MPTVSEAIRDRVIQRGIRIERFGNQVSKEVRKLLWDAHEDVLDQLEGRLKRIAAKGFDTGPVTTRRLKELSSAYRNMAEGLMPDVRQHIAHQMVEMGKDQAEWNATMFHDEMPVKLDMAIPTANTLRTMTLKQPFEGRILSEHTQHLGRQTLARFNKQVKIGLVNGETVDQIARRLRGTRPQGFRNGVLGWQRYEAQTIARTAIAHGTGVADEAFYSDNSRYIKGVQWSATLDTRTCIACQNLDGQWWKLGDTRPPKPLHFNCRCRYNPIPKSFRELGIDMDDVGEGTRFGRGGDVPAKMHYPEWLKKQSKSMQREALGPARYKRWVAGKETIRDFVNDQNQVLTLAQIRAREGR